MRKSAKPVRRVDRPRTRRDPEPPGLPAEIASLPLGHLQLKLSHRTAALYKTIGDIAVAAGDPAKVKPKAAGTIPLKRALAALATATAVAGADGWDDFRSGRPALLHPKKVFFYSPKLSKLSASFLSGSLAELHLSRRGINALGAIGINTIGNLIAAARDGITSLRASGALTAAEIVQALHAMAGTVMSSGDVDWIAYAERRRFLVLPEERRDSYTAAEFLRAFPRVCEAAVSRTLGPLGRVVLLRRVFRHPDIVSLLREVAATINLTSERIRLVEKEIEEMLWFAIWKQEYRGCDFRFRDEFLQPLYDLADRVCSHPSKTLSEQGWRSLLQECWDVTPAALGQQTSLLHHLLGLPAHLPDVGERILAPGRSPGWRSGKIARHIRRFIRAQSTRDFTVAELHRALTREMGEVPYDEAELRRLVASFEGVETGRDQDHYRVKLSNLATHQDRCERILSEHGSPLHFREILARIARAAPAAAKDTLRALEHGQLDKSRFIPLGRSGFWALKEWSHLTGGSVADLAAKILSGSHGPLTEKQLFDLMSEQRPVRLKSIGTLLSEDARFYRVAPATWALAASRSRD